MNHTIPPRASGINISQRCVERLQRIAGTVSPHLSTDVGAMPLYDGTVVPEPEPEQEPEPQQEVEPAKSGAELLLRNACFTPYVGATSEDDTEPAPVIGRVPGVTGLSVACGHHVWGITLGPATGAILARERHTPECCCLLHFD